MEFGFFAQGAVPEPMVADHPNLEHERLSDVVPNEVEVRSF